MDLNVAGKKLINLKNINMIIGKNDCGKSSILRYFSQLQDRLVTFQVYNTRARQVKQPTIQVLNIICILHNNGWNKRVKEIMMSSFTKKV